MPRFSASLFMFFNELALPERFAAVAAAGFKAVEYPFPYDYDKNMLADKLFEAGLTQVLINTRQGDWEAGDRGLAVLPDRIDEFQDSIGQAIEYAIALKCKQISMPAGVPCLGVSAEKTRETYLANLCFAADKMQEAGIRLLVEAINTYDMPEFYISHSQEAIDLMDACGHDNVWLLYDIYHMQRMEGEITATLSKHLSRIGHIQIADNPGRHEPGTGELNYSFLFQHLDNIGYTGWIGCEYWPAADTVAGLTWLPSTQHSKM